SCILSTIPRTTSSTLFPYTTLFRSCLRTIADQLPAEHPGDLGGALDVESFAGRGGQFHQRPAESRRLVDRHGGAVVRHGHALEPDRKSTRLNSSHVEISYAVFCLKK